MVMECGRKEMTPASIISCPFALAQPNLSVFTFVAITGCAPSITSALVTHHCPRKKSCTKRETSVSAVARMSPRKGEGFAEDAIAIYTLL